MTTLRLHGNYNDPWTQCEECDANFQTVWNRSATHTQIEFCPFCGDEVEEVVNEIDGNEVENDS